MALNTSTIITIGSILLVVCILSVARKTISAIMMTFGVCIIALAVIQATSDVVLIDFSNLADVAVHWALRLFQWAQDTFWPTLTDVARDIEQAL